MPHDASASCVDAICSNHGSTLMTSLPAHTINTTSELSVQRIIPNIRKYTMYLTSAAIMGDSQSYTQLCSDTLITHVLFTDHNSSELL